jgi:glycosyltransferase involved in cell wall biosynthesis
MALISVIVPVYNAESYLTACVESLLCQSLTDIEFLLIDDGSSDSSGVKCEQYANSDSRVRVFHQENRGVVYARNLGIEKACAPYLFFLDADDTLYDKNVLEMLYNRMNQDGVDMVVGDFQRINRSGEKQLVHRLGDSEVYSNVDALNFTFRYFPNFYLWGILYRKELFDDICCFRNYLIAEDQILLTSVMLKATNIVYMSIPVVNYFMSSTSVTQIPTLQKCIDFFDATCEVEKRVKEAGILEQLSFSLQLFLLLHIRLCFLFFDSVGFYRIIEIKERIRLYAESEAMCYIREKEPFLYKRMMTFSSSLWRYKLSLYIEKVRNVLSKR